jgi:hypothetical protein
MAPVNASAEALLRLLVPSLPIDGTGNATWSWLDLWIAEAEAWAD